MYECLEINSLSEGFGAPCLAQILSRETDEVETFQVNHVLAEWCASDIGTHCNSMLETAGERKGFEKKEGSVTSCLLDAIDSVSEKCHEELKVVIAVQSENVEADSEEMDACEKEVSDFCASEYKSYKADPSKEATVLLSDCIVAHRDEASAECRKEIEDNLVEEFEEDVGENLPFKSDCSSEIQEFCLHIEDGDDRIYECLEDNAHKESFGDKCLARVLNRMTLEGEDYRINHPLAVKCKKDIKTRCDKFVKKNGPDAGDETEEGAVEACLKDARADLEPDCQLEVFELIDNESQDFEADKEAEGACKPDIESFCKDVKDGEGEIEQCLIEHKDSLSDACWLQITDNEVEETEKGSETYYPFEKLCAAEVDKFCKSHKPEEVIACLERHSLDEGFGDTCFRQVAGNEVEEGRTFQINHELADACEQDIKSKCMKFIESEGSRAGFEKEEGTVTNCLTDARDDVDKKCKTALDDVIRVEGVNFEADIEGFKACRADAEKFCDEETKGRKGLFNCLLRVKDDVSKECAEELTDNEIEENSDISLDAEFEQGCIKELSLWCSSEEDKYACLEARAEEKKMSRECRSFIIIKERDEGRDYRINHKLAAECEEDIKAHCLDTIITEGDDAGEEKSPGAVEGCLTKNFDELRDSCKANVDIVIENSSQRVEADAQEESACANDVEKFCRGIDDDQGRLQDCLVQHKDVIEDDCAREVDELMENESRRVADDYPLREVCETEIDGFCKDVTDENGLVMKCLQKHAKDDDFGEACAKRVLSFESEEAGNYLLNHPLAEGCEHDIRRLCGESIVKSGEREGFEVEEGGVERCLVENVDSVSENCRDEIEDLQSLAVRDKDEISEIETTKKAVEDQDVKKENERSGGMDDFTMVGIIVSAGLVVALVGGLVAYCYAKKKAGPSYIEDYSAQSDEMAQLTRSLEGDYGRDGGQWGQGDRDEGSLF